MHNRFMCNANRAIRNLTNDPRCGICDNEYETILHVFRDCKVVREVWKKGEGLSKLLTPALLELVIYNNG